jgi:hypothetical protein
MSTPTPVLHRNVTLLRAESPDVLDEIRALVDLSGFVVGQVDAVTLIVDPARTGELAERLGAAGLSPLVQKLRAGPAAEAPEGIADADTMEMPRR